MKDGIATKRKGIACVVIAAIAIFCTAGCGGTSNNCDGVQGQFSAGAQTAGRTVVLYSLSNCDANGQNCQRQQVASTTTDPSGRFAMTGLGDGNYLAVVYAADNTTVIEQREFSVPGVCGGN